jgi:hypothetical protein
LQDKPTNFENHEEIGVKINNQADSSPKEELLSPEAKSK